MRRSGNFELQTIPKHCEHNAHMFYLKLNNIDQRTALIEHLKIKGIQAVFHYIPLHNSKAGKKYSTFSGVDKYTTIESEKILRLPMSHQISHEEVNMIIKAIELFMNK